MSLVLRRVVATPFLLLLLVQISPVTVSGPASISARGDGFALSIKPLPVCDNDTGLGGTFADHQWLSALNIETFCAPPAVLHLPAPSSLAVEGHTRRLLRPPRIPSSL